MTAYHDDRSGPYGSRPNVPSAPPEGPPPVNTTRLWSGGLATAVVAALVALVGVLVVRALLRIDLYAPRDAGAFGSADTVVLCATAAAAALLATGVAHLLLLSTPRPLAYLSWIVGLVTAVAVVLPFTYAPSIGLAFTQAVIHLMIGTAIGSLVSGAAAGATRTGVPHRPRFEIE